ncbi:MAG: cytochrome C assembly family protein [Wenzhouxiangella sp.]
MQAAHLIAALTALAYLAAGLSLALGFFHARRSWRLAGLALAVVALCGHGWTGYRQLSIVAGWDFNFLNSLSLVAWVVVLLLILTAFRSRLIEAGIIAFPGAALCVVLQTMVPVAPLPLDQLSDTLKIHVISSLLAYGVLSIAAINAGLLAVQEHLLRRPTRLRQLEMMPPLTVMEAMLFRLVGAGWLILTLSLGSGLLFIDDLFGQHLVHKTTLSLLSWLLFGGLLLGRWWLGWRGRRAIYWTLAAMLVLVLAYFGSKLVLEVILDRSWTSPVYAPLMLQGDG